MIGYWIFTVGYALSILALICGLFMDKLPQRKDVSWGGLTFSLLVALFCLYDMLHHELNILALFIFALWCSRTASNIAGNVTKKPFSHAKLVGSIIYSIVMIVLMTSYQSLYI